MNCRLLMPPLPAELNAYGLRMWRGDFTRMDRSHRHQEIELNWVEHGSLLYSFAGADYRVPAQQLALFWGAFPHRVIDSSVPTHFYWLTLPLGIMSQWPLVERLWQALLNGNFIIDDHREVSADALSFNRWNHDLNTLSEERHALVRLELYARLARLNFEYGSSLDARQRQTALSDARRPSSGADAIARFVRQHYLEALTIPQIAAAVGLHPNYAMALYKKAFGISIIETIRQYRIAHAQRLLLTSEDTILHIAMASGFGSSSQFYDAFERITGFSPGRYRSALRTHAAHSADDAP